MTMTASPETLNRLALLDRDGTINVDHNYVHTRDQFDVIPGAVEAIKRLHGLGFSVVVVTNQSGVQRGKYTVEQMHDVHDYLQDILQEHDSRIDAFYYSTAMPGSPDIRRKPMPGMALEAARDFNADLGRSVVIGDKTSDIGLARNVGARSILVRTGHGRETEIGGGAGETAIADDLTGAVEVIEQWLREGW
ncbi:HAD-IIIA family hydrolase [bacterium]|nr:HAD-IIIA family hydrolase [bacterium]